MPRIVFTGISEGWQRFLAARPDPDWELLHRPLLAWYPAADLTALDAALADPAGWDGIVLTSPRAAEIVARRVGGTALVSASRPVWWAIGPATAEPLEAIGIRPGQPSRTARTGKGLAAAMLAQGSGRFLYPGARSRSDRLPALLRATGSLVEEVEVYRTELASDAAARSAIEAGDVVIATSARIAGLLARNRGSDKVSPRLVTIGPTSAEAAARTGWPPDAVADGADPKGIVGAVESLIRSPASKRLNST